MNIFTDASKNQYAAFSGLAFFIPNSNIKQQFKIIPQGSIFTAEALAIILAIHHIKNQKIKDATIFTDSLSVLKALQNYYIIKSKNTSHLILDIKTLLHSCKTENVNITLIWIPSHCNIADNET